MPTIARIFLHDVEVGVALGATFLVVAALLDPYGIAGILSDVPFLVAMAVMLAGVAPFALCFAATGLEFRSASKRHS